MIVYALIRDDDVGFGILIVGIIVAMVGIASLAVVYPATYFNSMDTVSEMEAFQGHTMSVYEYTILETKGIEISAAEVGLIDVAYLEQGKTTSQRIKELRDKVEWYNQNLRQLERQNAHWLLDDFTYNVPEHLTPIVIKG